MFVPTGLVALSIVFLSAFAVSKSLGSIQNLSVFEEKAKKAADWSNTAEDQLWKTRITVATGFVSCIVSLLSGLAYLVSVWSGNAIYGFLLSGALFGAARYMQSFWSVKAQVPLLDQYNTAIKQSLDVITFTYLLSAGWAIVTLLRLVGL